MINILFCMYHCDEYLFFCRLGFAFNQFSTSPTLATSNQVNLTNGHATYSCEIHPDKVTATQITCYSP